MPISVGISPSRSLSAKILRSPPPPPLLSAAYTHTQIALKPASLLYANTLLSSPPCSPTRRASVGWAADPTLQGEAVGPHAQEFKHYQVEQFHRERARQQVAVQAPALATSIAAVLSALHPHTQRSHPPTSLYANTLLPSTNLLTHPVSPLEGGSLGG